MAGLPPAIETLRERIATGEAITDDDREVLLAFSDELALRGSEYSAPRHEKLLRHCTIMAEQVGGLAAALEDRDATETIVRWINATYDNEETNSDYRTAVRVMGRRVAEAEPDRFDDGQLDTDGYPVSVAWVPSGTSSTYDPAPDPSKMLRWQIDVVPMLDATQNDRDAAMIALEFDAGLRGGEFYDLRVGAISDSEFGLQATVRGKRGQRTVTLVPSVPYVIDWRSNGHPAPADPEAPMWSRLDAPDRLSKRMVLDALRAAARRAGVTKPVTPTNFRKSSAAHLASKGMNQAHLEDHHGWVRGSKVAARYISVFAADAEVETARIWGKEVPTRDDDTIAPVDCPRCGKETPREKPLCMWCGQALEPTAASKAERVDAAMVEAIGRATAEEAAELIEARRETRHDPEALAMLIERLEPLLDD